MKIRPVGLSVRAAAGSTREKIVHCTLSYADFLTLQKRSPRSRILSVRFSAANGLQVVGARVTTQILVAFAAADLPRSARRRGATAKKRIDEFDHANGHTYRRNGTTWEDQGETKPCFR